MTIRSRPVLDRKHRPRWQDELRTQQLTIIGFTGTLLMKLPGPLTADQDKQLRTIQTSARQLLSPDSESAVGNMPATIATVVMTIGCARLCPAS